MKTRHYVPAILILVSMTALGVGFSALKENARSDAADVKAALVSMWQAVEEGNLERYLSYIHPQITSFGENDVYLAEGKDAEQVAMALYLKRATGVHTEMRQPQVTVRGDVAWIVYYYSEAGRLDGKDFAGRGKSTRIFVRENGRWLCIHGHYTAVP